MAPLHFGVLLIPFQTTDVSGPLDIISNCSKQFFDPLLAAGHPMVPAEVAGKAIDIVVHHIGETLDPVTLSAGFNVLPSTTVDDCPKLDYLIIGGPDPINFKLGEKFTAFVQNFVKGLDEGKGKGLFTTCTGGFAIAGTGVLDGKKATANHGILPLARKLFPKVDWKEEQWVIDGKIWTAGGACAGMDMMAHWVIENYGLDVAKVSLWGLDFEPRDINGGLVLERQHGVAQKV